MLSDSTKHWRNDQLYRKRGKPEIEMSKLNKTIRLSKQIIINQSKYVIDYLNRS